MITLPQSIARTVAGDECRLPMVAPPPDTRRDSDDQVGETTASCHDDPSSLLLVGIITYDPAEDRHALVMTRAWEQRLSKGWIERKYSPASQDRHILDLLAKGAGSKQIARALSSSSDSAGRKIKRALTRLGVGSRAEAIVLATRLKWIGPD